jgi:hypothetical protein
MLKPYYRFNTATGLSIHIQPDGEALIDGLTLTLNNQQLDLGRKINGIKSVAGLKEYLPAKTIIALNLTGKGILTKQIERLDEITEISFNKILPNANIGDFYVQNFVSGNHSFISVIRKAEADKWYSQLYDAGYNPVMLSLGPFVIQQVIGQLNIYGEEVIFNGHSIKRDEQKEWLSYTYAGHTRATFKIKLQNEVIDETLLLPYASAFQLLLNDRLDLVKTNADQFDSLFNSKHAEKKLRINAAAVLLTAFFLLLINFALFTWLGAANDILNARLSTTIKTSNDLKINTDQIREKENILQTLGWDGDINKSKLVNDMTSIMPADMVLTGITIDPVDRSESQDIKSITFINKRIRVVGYAEKILSVNEWIARIETRQWAKGVRLDNYMYNNEMNTGVFTLNIDYQ